jgi:hypothetical protein
MKTEPRIFCNQIKFNKETGKTESPHLKVGEQAQVYQLTCAICGKLFRVCAKCVKAGDLGFECQDCGIRHCPDCREHPDMAKAKAVWLRKVLRTTP